MQWQRWRRSRRYSLSLQRLLPPTLLCYAQPRLRGAPYVLRRRHGIRCRQQRSSTVAKRHRAPRRDGATRSPSTTAARLLSKSEIIIDPRCLPFRACARHSSTAKRHAATHSAAAHALVAAVCRPRHTTPQARRHAAICRRRAATPCPRHGDENRRAQPPASARVAARLQARQREQPLYRDASGD
jgi:hypothetical protein